MSFRRLRVLLLAGALLCLGLFVSLTGLLYAEPSLRTPGSRAVGHSLPLSESFGLGREGSRSRSAVATQTRSGNQKSRLGALTSRRALVLAAFLAAAAVLSVVAGVVWGVFLKPHQVPTDAPAAAVLPHVPDNSSGGLFEQSPWMIAVIVTLCVAASLAAGFFVKHTCQRQKHSDPSQELSIIPWTSRDGCIIDSKGIVRYHLSDRIGSGVTADVYRVSRVAEGIVTNYAMKVYKGSENQSDSEAQVLRRLQGHENIVAFVEGTFQVVGIMDDDTPCLAFVMELVSQGSTYPIALEGAMVDDLAWIAHVAKDVLQALAYIHDSGIVHGDLKPDNLAVTSGGAIKVLDFSSAREILSNGLAPCGGHLGSLLFAAPELAVKNPAFTAKVDIYSLGMTLLCFQDNRLLTDNSFVASFTDSKEAGNSRQFLDRMLDGIKDGQLKDLLDSMLANDPTQRPTAQALLGHPFILQNCAKIIV